MDIVTSDISIITKNKIHICIILVILTILIIQNKRLLLYELMIFFYKIYSLYGISAYNNPYPIDYPYDREDLIPKKYMLEFNHICYYRQLTGDNDYKKNEMKNLIKQIETYCKYNLQIQKAKELPILYPFNNKDDYDKMKYYIKMKFPFVIRGGDWKTNKQNININNLIQKYGDTTVMFDKDSKFFKGKFKDIEIHQGYLSNSTSFIKKHPEIINIDDINKLSQISGLSHTISQIFISLIPNNGTPMHSAFSHNFFFMIEGQKKWTFWHPDYLCMMYPYFPENGIYFGSYSGIRDLSVDIDILEKYPLFNYAPRYEIILQEGDVLFNPGPWWHAIRNITETSLAIATRWIYNDIMPSPNQLQYCQIANNNIYKMFREIYINTGNFKFDVDENYSNEVNNDSISLIEVLNHDSLQLLKDDTRSLNWHEYFTNIFT
jgi:hypothetical protein